eukprot:Skav202150  [mRNA]  locus=scaffold970:142130:165817:- [translate_table: standard]
MRLQHGFLLLLCLSGEVRVIDLAQRRCVTRASDDSWYVRSLATEMLLELGPRGASNSQPVLVKALHSLDSEVRRTSAITLGKHGQVASHHAAALCARMLANRPGVKSDDPDADLSEKIEVRTACMWALGQLDPDSVVPLIHHLDDGLFHRNTESKSRPKSKTEEEPKSRSKERSQGREQGRGCSPALFDFVDAEAVAQGESCRLDVTSSEQDEAANAHVPGMAAPVCNAEKVWNSMARWILKKQSPFAKFLKSLLSTTFAVEAKTTSIWPMPVPYPEVWLREGAPLPLSPSFRSRRKAVNLLVAMLDWLHMNKPGVAPPSIALAAPLSKKQWEVVRRFERLMLDVAEAGDIDASSMGRTAAKMEGLDSMLNTMQQEAASWREAGYEQRYRAQRSCTSKSGLTPGSLKGGAGVVVGKLAVGAPVIAKPVIAERLSVPAAPPEFDPTGLFTEPHATVYDDPISTAMAPEATTFPPPKVRVHATREQALAFVKFLDDRDRLELIPGEKARRTHLCGAFSLAKDLEKDRLIVDARPANQLEHTLQSWTRTMGSVSALIQHELLPAETMYCSGTDLRDYYYCFKVSSRRSKRNALRCPLTHSEASQLQCFSKAEGNHRLYYPALRTLAMGDNNAVELGQHAHLKIGLAAGIIHPRDLITTHGRAPRSSVSCGLIIDDIVFLQASSRVHTVDDPSDAARRLAAMKSEYERYQLAAHPKKTFTDETKVEFWGAALDGVSGLVRPAPRRLVPLLSLTARVASFGFATVALLQVLAGSWVSVLQYRRRTLSILETIYEAQWGREDDDVVQLDPKLTDELWSLTILGPVLAADLRAQSSGCVYMSDASEEAQAVVACQVPQQFAKELQRHSLSRGGWSKLLSPWKSWLKSRNWLDLDAELPGGVPLVSHPLWLKLATCLQYEKRLFQRVKARRHINVLELEVVLMLEKDLAKRGGDLRYCLGADSQVTLACLVKGRSSSPRLNAMLRQSWPTFLGAGLVGNYGFVPSLANPGDDPTRDRAVRSPSEEFPAWLTAAFEGKFELMDDWLERLGYDPLAVADLPFTEGTHVEVDEVVQDFLPQLRAVQKPERLARFDEVHTTLKPPCTEPLESHCTVTGSYPVSPTAALPAFLHGCTDDLGSVTQESSSSEDVSLVENQRKDQDQNGEKPKEKHKRPKKKKKRRALQKTTRCLLPEQGTPSAVGGSVPVPEQEGSPSPSRLPRGATAAHEAMSHFAENADAKLLSPAAVQKLASFPAAQFFAPGGRRASASFVPRRQGILDLYSGQAGVARWLSKKFHVWVLTFDFDHGMDQNLLDTTVQQSILEAIELDCFSGMGAAPDCSSFSRAITPAVRDALYPFGRPGITPNMEKKVAIGNLHAAFMLKIILVCIQRGLYYWVENPDGSFLWLLPTWLRHGIGAAANAYRFDQCRYATPWRKRTRVATNTELAGVRHLCAGGHSHLVLRGRSSAHGACWTKVAQVYPRSLCRFLGNHLAASIGLRSRQRLNVNSCAKCSAARIGEAANPGPARPRHDGPRDPDLLADVRLVEPGTAARQDKMLALLAQWLQERLSTEAMTQLFMCPPLAVEVLKAYARDMFATGKKLYELRYTLIAVQQRFPALKPSLGPVWAIVSKWEMLQPLQHRKPLPELLFKAMFVLACLKNWKRWAGAFVIGYEGIARMGEVLQARRADLLLPLDLLEANSDVAFLKVRQPKTRYRGRGRVQHLKLQNPAVLPFLTAVFGSMDPALNLFPLSANVFRKRWDALLDLLEVPLKLRPTPGGVRGGGAIVAYRRGEPIADILWRMRLTAQPTLASYLQELAADSLVAQLPQRVRQRILNVASLFDICLRSLKTH